MGADLRALLKEDYEKWPKDEYEAQRCAFPEAFRALMDDHRMHDYTFEGLRYENPTGQCYANPTLVVELSDGPETRYELIFPHIFELEIATREALDAYFAEHEDVMLAAAQFSDGRFEMVMQMASGLGIYVKSAGIDVRKEKW